MARFMNKNGLAKQKVSAEPTGKKKTWKLDWAKDYLLAIWRIAIAVLAVFLAHEGTEFIFERVDFYALWWLKFAIASAVAILILLTLGAAFPSNDNSKKIRRVVTGLVLLFLLGWYLLPQINARNFNGKNEPVKWINLKTREVYKDTLNPVNRSGTEPFFLHPTSLDTCVPLTKERLHPQPRVVKPRYVYVYDTIFDQVYRQQGEVHTGIIGNDIERGDIIRIYNENGKGTASFRINKDKDIFVSPLSRETKYTAKAKVTSDFSKHFRAQNRDGSIVRVQLIRGKYVPVN